MDEREKSYKKKACTSEDFIRMEITEDGNWANIKRIHQNEPTIHTSTLNKSDEDAIISYSTNREKIYHRNEGTIEEVHVLESSGKTTDDFAEEHWSSEIKSFIMRQPPKFIQVIKAFRVLASDALTLIVEVQSDPPAIFEWFCNDRPMQQNRRKFKVHHGINITTLTVEGPEQGVYKCTSRNPIGISTTYGYVTVTAPLSYKTWLKQTHEVNKETDMKIIDKENTQTSIDVPPKFIQQIPNLTLRPGNEALIDVEVEASPPAKFIWYVNGIQCRDTVGQMEVYYPTDNRCIARFPIPQKGEYKVVAENRAGKEHSIGYIDIKNEIMYHQTHLPPLPNDLMYYHYTKSEHHEIPLLEKGRGRASSMSRVADHYEESSYYQRSTSLPRQVDCPHEINENREIVRKYNDNSEQLQQQQQQQKDQQYCEFSSSIELAEMREQQSQTVKRRRCNETAHHLLPQKPVFTNKLPINVTVSPGEDLLLTVEFKAIPRANVKWSVNGFELKDSKKVTVINEEGRSMLICRPPIRRGRYSITLVNEYGISDQTTRVLYDEGKQYGEIKESHSLSSKIPEHSISAYTSTTPFGEMLDELQWSGKSFENIKYVETVRAVTEKHETPIPRDQTSTSRQLLHSSTHVIQQSEGSSDGRSVMSYKVPAIVPKTNNIYNTQSFLEPIISLIHEPLGLSVPVVPEISYSSPHVENRYEEITSGILKTIYEPSPDETMLHKPLTDMAEQKYEEAVRSGSEVMINGAPSPKLQSQKEIEEHKINGKKILRTSLQHIVEPIPKHPFILKQPEPEIRLKAGEKLVLESKVDSFPVSQFKWYQNNFEVRVSPSVIIENPAVNESRATFLKPISGIYKMVASNIHGSCSSTTRVITEVIEEITESIFSVVRAVPEKQEPKYQLIKRSHTGTRNDLPKAPRIVEGFAPVLKIASNEPLVLRVTADAVPEAEFRWMLNNFEVRTSQTVVIQHLAPNVSQVTFHSPISGRCEVIGINYLGQDSCSGKIIVNYENEAQIIPTEPIEKPIIPKVPVFIKPLPGETQLCSEVQEFRLSVSVHGEGPITFRWFADGSLLSNSVEHQMINDMESSILVVWKQIECDVDYAVEVSNAYGAAWSETTVIPPLSTTSLATSTTSLETQNSQRHSPCYTTVLMDKYLQHNDEFTARVTINAESSPCEFVWMLNGRDIRIIPGFHVESTFYESILYIKSALSKHSGELSVIASNKYGTARSAAKIIVHPLLEESYEFVSEVETIPTEQPSQIVSSLQQPSVFRAERKIAETTTAETGGEIQLIQAISKPQFGEIMSKQYKHDMVVSCKVISETPVVISWYKDGQRLRQTHKYLMHKLAANTYTLTICSFDRSDEGPYFCCAENIYGSSETDIYIRPSIRTEISKEILVEENDSEVVGLQDDIGYVKKKYIDTTVKIEPEVSSSQEVYSHTAELRKIEAEYKLLVKVAEIVASKLVAKVVIDEAISIVLRRINAEVQYSEEEEFESICERHPCSPRFETNIECYTVDVGDTVVLHTDIGGYPEPCVEWYFGEQKIEQSEETEVKYVNEQAILRIKKVEKKNEGTYYCHAENEYGKAVLSCNLCVTDSALEWSESTYKMTGPPLIYTSTEIEAEISSNVHVTHAEESYDHYFSSVQPETFALCYSCFASKVHYDSAIVIDELTQKMIENEQKSAEVILNVNVERTSSVFKHDARILQSANESVTTSQREPQYRGAREVIRTKNIFLIGDQRVLQQHQSLVNTVTTVVFEKPPQQALHIVTCLYDEKEHLSKDKVQAVCTIDLREISVNELMSTVMATQMQEKFREAYVEANVNVRRPDAIFDHFITVIELEHKYPAIHLVVPIVVSILTTVNFHLQQKLESLNAESVYTEYPRRNATAEQRIVILQSSFQKFSEAITWNLKKVIKKATESGITVAHANVKIYKPEEIGEHTTTIIDSRKIVPKLFAIAAAASKLKLTSIFVTFTKKGDVAHQALVIEYESFVEDEATLNVAMLTAPGFHSKQESVWTYEKKNEKFEETEIEVVAVFLEINITCPNQTIELVASLPPSAPTVMDVVQSSQSYFEPLSVSWSESSSTGLLQVPKFIKTLENVTAIVGEFHQFKCIVSGTPAPIIQWYVDGDIIYDSDIYQTIYEDGVCILKIRELAIEDEGEYICEATNDAGQAVTKCFLQTITEADALKYQQQAIFENILYNNGGNNNNANDNLASLDNISNVNGNHIVKCNTLIQRDGNSSTSDHRKQFLVVNYKFARNEPVIAETAVVVTRYITSSKGFYENLASGERSFNISVFLPNTAMECDFIWALTNCGTIALSLMSVDFAFHNFPPQQIERAHLLLFMKKLTFENVSFVISQPWEEILLLKKPESAFVWGDEFFRMQKTRLEFLTKSSNENICSEEPMKNIVLGMAVDAVEGYDILQVEENGEDSEKATRKQNEKIPRYRDEEENESRIHIIPQDMIYREKDADDEDRFKWQTFEEYLEIDDAVSAAMRQYIDEPLDFNSDISVDNASINKENNINSLNATSSQMGNDFLKNFINEEYLNCSFCYKSECVKINRNLLLPELILSSNHVTGNSLSYGIAHLKSNPNPKILVPSKKSIETKAVFRSLSDYDLDENSKQNDNPGSKETNSTLDSRNSTSDMQASHLTADSLHFTNSIENADVTIATFDASEEFEVFCNSANSRLQYDQSSSTLMHVNEYNLPLLEADYSNPFYLTNSETVNTSISNTRISCEESPSAHDAVTTRAVCRENEIKMKSGDNEEALQIERAIYDISERIEHQQFQTEAQAEASEELLKTILEDIIKNTRSSVIQTMIAYKGPVILLREKLIDLEETLKRESFNLEFRDSSMNAFPETQSALSKSFSAEDKYTKSIGESSVERGIYGISLCDLQRIGNINKQEIKRMTPLTLNIKEQLQSLECMLEEVEKEGDDMEELTGKIRTLFPVYPKYPNANQHQIHNILMQINREINIIKRYCQRNISKASVDTAVDLLHKVCSNVSSMIDLISSYKKKLRKKPVGKGLNVNRERIKSSRRSSHHLSLYSRTGFFFKTEASVNLHLAKRAESEIINAIVKLFSSSDNCGNKTSKDENSEISTYENTIFDNENKTVQETGIGQLLTLVSESKRNGESMLSNSFGPESNTFSPYYVQHTQTAPVHPPRRQKEKSQHNSSSPPPTLPRRSKSCGDYKNPIVRSCFTNTLTYPLSLIRNISTNIREAKEVAQLDTLVYDNDRLDSLNNANLLHMEGSSALISEQKSKNLKIKEISYEKIIRKKESFYSCSYVRPSKVKYRISLRMSGSVHFVHEDSDYVPESFMHSPLLFKRSNRFEGETEKTLLQTLALLSDLNTSRGETIAENITKIKHNFAGLKDEVEGKEPITPKLDINYNQNQKMNGNLKLIENPRSSTSEDSEFEASQKPVQCSHLSAKSQELPITNPSEDETNSLHEIESIGDKDEILDELDDLMVICNPHASVIDSIDSLPTIIEDGESPKIINSFMSDSTNTVVALSMSNTDEEKLTLKSKSELTAEDSLNPLNRKECDMYGVNYLDRYKKKVILICESEEILEETKINISYTRPSNKLEVLAVLSPEIQAKAEASTLVGEDFDVLIEQPDEAQDFVVEIVDRMSDSISIDLILSSTIEVDLSFKRDEQCESILSYQVKNLVDGESDEERIKRNDYDCHHYQTSDDKERRTGISVNIIARSMHDVAQASLEEIPWGEVSMHVVTRLTMNRSITDSETRNSLIQNVTVSESNETEKRSLRSHESFRSSQQSFDWNEFEFGDRNDSGHSDIPSFMVREGSTATITCEFNNFLTPGSFIDWFKGKAMVEIVPGKTDRISHDLLEVLVISHMSLTDADIYSIRVNDVIYPVACLIIENDDAFSEEINDDVHFISPPQTLFVMEGQPSIISCQVSRTDQKIEWCKDNKKWVTGNERIRLEADQFGYHRIIIDKSELEDQGTYYAFLGHHFTTVTLIVEERIDEREVIISSLGTNTDDDDCREYLVPLGSTATIAYELESSDEVQKLVWRKDGTRIEFSNDAKIENVVNGLKNYLVIHNAQADDSASYSICINDIEFKIAHLVVSNYATAIRSKYTKRISRSPLH